MSRRRGRITVQEQPTKETRALQRLARLPFLIVSVFFVIIGVTELIPHAGLFGVVWTLMVGSFVVIGVFNLVRKNGISHRVGYDVENDLDESIVGLMDDVVEGENVENSTPTGTTESRLLELQSLYDRQLITYEEYEAKRKDILSDL